MRYNLFEKEAAPDWETAKERLIKSTSLDHERIGEDYKKAFPYDYDPNIHFVYEGNITAPYKINEDMTLYFYTDKEQAEKGYRLLRDGERIEFGELIVVPSPGNDYRWYQGKCILERDYLIAIGAITVESEKEKARQERERQFKALDLYDKAVLREDASEGAIEKQARDQFRADWLSVPNTYEDLTQPIENLYPTMPDFIKYFS